MNNSLLAKIFLLVALLGVVGGVCYYKIHHSVPKQESVLKGEFAVSSVRVVAAGEYEFLTKQGRIHAKLRGCVSSEAKDPIVRLINSASFVKIIIIADRGDGTAMVDVVLTIQSVDVNLWSWLVERQFACQPDR